ncbi:MAG: hypothetical protein ACE5F2_02680 [Candidatus Paceibacteria bacterium]
MTMLVLLTMLLIGMVGSEAYAIRYYCYTCKSLYEVAGSHKNCVSALKTYPVAQERKYVPARTESKSYTSFNLFPVKAFVKVRIVQRPVRYRFIREYVPGYGYRHVRRYNFFRDIFDHEGRYNGHVRSRRYGRYGSRYDGRFRYGY